MRKLHFVFVLAIASSLLMQSCMKCDHDFDRNKTVTQQTINATVSENTTYNYMLPMPAQGNAPVITTDAIHAANSAITADANGNLIYQYTPATNYTGSDVVVLTTHNAPPQGGGFGGPGQGNCTPGGHGGCNHPCDNTTIITIDLTVTPTTAVTVSTAAIAVKQGVY